MGKTKKFNKQEEENPVGDFDFNSRNQYSGSGNFSPDDKEEVYGNDPGNDLPDHLPDEEDPNRTQSGNSPEKK